MKQVEIPFMQLRGGSSKGLYFLSTDLPADGAHRNEILLNAMGRGDRQIDGLGGADPLTSKVAIVGPASRDDADIDFLFAQIVVGEDVVDTTPNCGNILAGVGPYAVEVGLVEAGPVSTTITVHMVNSGKLCELQLCTPGGAMEYEGSACIDGVPGTAAPVICNYRDVAGSICGSLLPTGNVSDVFDGVAVTCVDNGMPVIVLRATDFGLSGNESPEVLNADESLKARLESIRLQAGPRMNLGDVSDKAVPKMCLVSPARHGGLINTRTFIPHKCHSAVGVLGAVSAATACILPGSVAENMVEVPAGEVKHLSVEHPSGEFSISLEVDGSSAVPEIRKAGLLRTARLLSRGVLYVPDSSKRGES
jgi:4-oxalomesaconate tautomerase